MIIGNPSTFRGVKGITVLPTKMGGILGATEWSRDSEMELAYTTVGATLSGSEREALIRVREQVKEWRRSPSWRVESKSIILIERRRAKRNVAGRKHA